MSNIIEQAEQWLSNLWAKFKGVETQVENAIPTIEAEVANVTNQIVNGLKTLQSSQLVQFCEQSVITIIEGVNPALKPFFDGLTGFLQTAVVYASNAAADLTSESAKPLDQQAQDGLAAIQQLATTNKSAFVTKIAGIAGQISDFALSNNAVESGVTSPGVGAMIAVQQAVHANS